MSKTNTVAIDLAPHPLVQWAVICRGQLLPMRFATEDEAYTHLAAMGEDSDRRSISARAPSPP
jgi:hypothetical protein